MRGTDEIKDACEARAEQASTSKRWFGLASVNVAMMALLAGVVTFVVNPDREGVRMAQTRPSPPMASGPLTITTQPELPKPAVVVTPAVQVAPAQPVPAAVARPAPAVRVRYVWVVQVGSYVQEVNAQNTRARVEDLGLETGAEPVTTASGQLYRVRVGPFTHRDEAEKSALRIRSLDLPALVLRQRP